MQILCKRYSRLRSRPVPESRTLLQQTKFNEAHRATGVHSTDMAGSVDDETCVKLRRNCSVASNKID